MTPDYLTPAALHALPTEPARFIFIADDGSETLFQPASESDRIRAIAGYIRQHSSPGSAVGLLFRTGPDLLRAWFGSLLAGLEPLVLQYPTRKQSGAYWADSVTHTVATTGLGLVIADSNCTALGLPSGIRVIGQSDLHLLPPFEPGPYFPEKFAIIQLSSGTTGHRKAMRFTSDQLARHVADFNEALLLTPDDTIVSWLPLYHDMGYIACLVMPLLLGVPVVMMDPMTWVAQPALLAEAIERHRGTVCYMPNFGFEVMARVISQPLPTMRAWVSCSEPVSAATIRRFTTAISAAPDKVAACYAMAENVFAVTLGYGCATRTIDGYEITCCGRPVPSVELKIIADEIWVRSPVSLAAYLDGHDIRDPQGFYPTGDLGRIVDGELFVLGRRNDLLVQAGRKFLLSDLDRIVNELRPGVRGRSAALSLWDEALGTETAIVLVEAGDFLERDDSAALTRDVRLATGLDAVEVVYVPPRFLTKTSSGKINRRRSREDWVASLDRTRRPASRSSSPLDSLKASFQALRWDQPVGTALDSLSTVILRIALDGAGLSYDRDRSLDDYAASLSGPDTRTEPESGSSLRLVSLADRFTIDRIDETHLARLGMSLGLPVTLEHVCLPPSPIVLSDLVFETYFQPRLPASDFAAISRTLDKLRGASVIIVDDMAEMAFLYESVYGVLSHSLRRDPRADLISVRWQDYAREHHRLPLTVVAGVDIPLTASSTALRQMEHLLDVPVFRIANIPGFASFTRDWDYRPLDTSRGAAVDPDALLARLSAWLAERRADVSFQPRRRGSSLQNSDLAHFCSCSVDRSAIDALVARYGSFCIAGEEASLPYVQKAIERAGKPFRRVPSLANETIAPVEPFYECLLICGAYGEPRNEKPVVALQHIGGTWRTRNLGGFEATLPPLNDMPESGDDWFHTFELARLRDYQTWMDARHALRAGATVAA